MGSWDSHYVPPQPTGHGAGTTRRGAGVNAGGGGGGGSSRTNPVGSDFGSANRGRPQGPVQGPFVAGAGVTYEPGTSVSAIAQGRDDAAFLSWLDSVGMSSGGGGGGGGGSYTAVDQAALQAQQNAIQETLDATLAHIGDTFTRMQEEFDRQKQAGLVEIQSAREEALSSLTGIRNDLATQNASIGSKIAAAVQQTRRGISSDADAVLRDLGNQGVEQSESMALSEQNALQRASEQGQIQGDLQSRLSEISDQYLGRNQQTTSNISQGAKGDLTNNYATLISQAAQDRADREFTAQEQARQALLQLTLNPPTRTVRGGGGGGRGGGGRGLNDDQQLMAIANYMGLDPLTTRIDLLQGNDPFYTPDAPEVSDAQWAAGQIGSDPELASAVAANIGTSVSRGEYGPGDLELWRALSGG